MEKSSFRLKLVYSALSSVTALMCVYLLTVKTTVYPSFDSMLRLRANDSMPRLTGNDSIQRFAANNSVLRLRGHDTRTHKLSEQRTILVYNPTYMVNVKQYNAIFSRCSFRNCKLTSDKRNIGTHSAIIFVLTEAPRLPVKPPLSPSERDPNQVWIFSWLEAPARHSVYGLNYKNKNWRATVNWTQSYMFNSELYYPYGGLRKRTKLPAKNYSEIYHRKTKMAAWIVSNCVTQSRRMKFVSKLREHGIDVDMYGRCAGKYVNGDKIRKQMSMNYKFYLAFENSMCKDYITEKFFSYYDLDVILVTRGGGNYTHFVANDSFVNSADFRSVEHLADHLKFVASNKKLYIRYMKNKDRYEAISKQLLREKSICNMCEKLNKLESNRVVHKDYGKSVDNCFEPTDLQ